MVNRGDTIIEVILGVTIFSFVAVGALALMNSGTAMAQRSLETTLVRQQIDAQAEMLRYISHSPDKLEQWGALKSSKVLASDGSPVSVLNAAACPAFGGTSKAFALNTTNMNTITSISAVPDTYAKVDGGAAQGVSIQLVQVSGDTRLYDAYIQACWTGPGGSRPMTIGTIVRIYDTAN